MGESGDKASVIFALNNPDKRRDVTAPHNQGIGLRFLGDIIPGNPDKIGAG